MPNQTLELSEHELYFLPPGTPATAPATRVEVEVGGEKRAFLGRSEIYVSYPHNRCSRYLFYREDVDDAIIFGGQSWLLKISHLKTAEEIAESVKFLINNNRAISNRYWRSPDAAFGIIFMSNARAYLQAGDMTTSRDNVPFNWSEYGNEKEFCSWSQPKFLEFCSRVAEAENSPLQYALIWRALSEERKDAIAFGCEHGDWDVMRHYFLLAAKVVTHQCGTFPLPEGGLTKWKIDMLWPREKVPSALSWSSRWRAALSQIFRPSFYRDEPLCVSEWRTWTNLTRCAVECALPTHHEALEAQLELREFLRPHLTDDEIEKLLHPPINQL